MTQYQGCQEAVDERTCDRELGHEPPHEMVDQIVGEPKGEYVLIRWTLQRDAPEVQRYYARAAADDPEEAAAQAEDAMNQEVTR